MQSATGSNRFVNEITWHATPTWPAGGTAAPRYTKMIQDATGNTK